MADKRAPKKLLEMRKTISNAKLAQRSDDLVPTLQRGTVIKPPDSLLSDKVREQWKVTVSNLIDLEIVTLQDLPSLEQGFIILEEFHRVKNSLDEIRAQSEAEIITDDDTLTTIVKLQKSLTNLSNTYNSILGKFGVTPTERAKMEWGHLKEQESKNPIEALLGNS